MTTAEIKAVQRAVGTEADGIWGPKSIAACQKHLKGLMPSPNPWPASGQAALRKFYGEPGESGQGLMFLDVSSYGVRYDGAPVGRIRCHALCADSLLRVISEIARGPHRNVLQHYAGCFNYRPVRGGGALSLHAWGAAIDLWPEKNGNKAHWPTAAAMPLGVMEAFAREGWMAAGAWWHRDAMHFQATR